VLPNIPTPSTMGSSRVWQEYPRIDSSPCHPSFSRGTASGAFPPSSQDNEVSQQSNIRAQIAKIEQFLCSERLRLRKRLKNGGEWNYTVIMKYESRFHSFIDHYSPQVHLFKLSNVLLLRFENLLPRQEGIAWVFSVVPCIYFRIHAVCYLPRVQSIKSSLILCTWRVLVDFKRVVSSLTLQYRHTEIDKQSRKKMAWSNCFQAH
jgi:hypothetical protein